MHIVCVMFSRGLGGMEQSLLDYCSALSAQGHKVTAFIHPGAMIETPLNRLVEESDDISIECLRNFGQWDFLAANRFRKMLRKIHPDAVITFGNRAVSLAKHAAKGIAPVIARTPNYSVKRLIGLEGIFHTTKHLREHISSLGHPEESLYHIPNMIAIPDDHKFSFKKYGKPPVIGTMGRFVKKKGMAEFLHALDHLNEKGVKFKAVIGGEGEEEKHLRRLVKALDLADKVEFIGWVDDKDKFFREIDIFCLPSLLEPFGIVLLEAFLHGKPVVTTNTEGPSEIAMDEHDALIVPKGNTHAMADALKELVMNQKKAEVLAINALKTIKKRYDTKVVGEQMHSALEKIVAGG